MKSISYWALLHQKTTWMILILVHTVLGLGAFELGIWLASIEMGLPPGLLWLGMAIFLFALVLYPIRRSKYRLFKWNYVRQKWMDLCLVLSGVVMMITMANTEAIHIARSPGGNTWSAVQVAVFDPVPEGNDLGWWRMIRKQGLSKTVRIWYQNNVKNRLSVWKDQGAKPASPAFIIILMILGILVVLALSCAWACSGGGAIVLLAMGIGIVGILMLGVPAVKKAKARRQALE